MIQPAVPIVLASSSQFRRQLLEQFGCAFSSVSPDLDESQLPDETPLALVERLSVAKAAAVAASLDVGLVIGSDLVAALDGEVIGKPLSEEAAVSQLERSNGREVTYLTGLAVINASSGHQQLHVSRTLAGFRELTSAQIRTYVQRDQPLYSAGSIRAESLGIALFRYLRGDDPSALIGLPLARLAQMLANEGVDVFAPN